ncbi:transcription factor HBP-1b(c38)-like [Iris pallida]|uniref:Transcription factor HBP-1b(C38)-like n=1 Tax=Iris pallida TaxID=29817 RepID=A0AAX6IIT2_IRIPA|nr:transcription factor HBP-1b(c38)-like [Iris pallida]
MPSFVAHQIGTERNDMHLSRFSDFGVLEQSMEFRTEDATDLSRNLVFNSKSSGPAIVSDPLQFGSFAKQSLEPICITPSVARVDSVPLIQQKVRQPDLVSLPSGHFENWGESTMADGSPRTDTSTDIEADDRNQRFEQGQGGLVVASDSSERSKERTGDHKTLRRLAQNREAARKSRLRKKAYVQQLESSRLKLTQIEQEVQRAPPYMGIFISNSGDQSHSMSGNGPLAFDVEYARWVEDQNRQINELRAAVNAHASDNDLRAIVDGVMAHWADIFKLKSTAAKADVFHMLSGMWKTPAERCFLWLGAFDHLNFLSYSQTSWNHSLNNN